MKVLLLFLVVLLLFSSHFAVPGTYTDQVKVVIYIKSGNVMYGSQGKSFILSVLTGVSPPDQLYGN